MEENYFQCATCEGLRKIYSVETIAKKNVIVIC